jgi:hypothetical protein
MLCKTQMKYILSILKKISREEKKVLGRWNLDYSKKKINSKIDLANEDHCGPCGQYRINKVEIKNEIDEQIRFIYMV